MCAGQASGLFKGTRLLVWFHSFIRKEREGLDMCNRFLFLPGGSVFLCDQTLKNCRSQRKPEGILVRKAAWCSSASYSSLPRWRFSSSARLSISEAAYFFYNHTGELFLPWNNQLFVTSVPGFRLPCWEKSSQPASTRQPQQQPGLTWSQVRTGSATVHSAEASGEYPSQQGNHRTEMPIYSEFNLSTHTSDLSELRSDVCLGMNKY